MNTTYGAAAVGIGKHSALRRRLTGLSALTSEEDDFLAGLESASRTLPAGAAIAEEGQVNGDIFVLLQGWAIRYRSLEDGSRMIIDFVLPGEFVNIGSVLNDVADYSVSTLTRVSAWPITRESLVETFQRFPKLALAMMCLWAREEARLIERLLTIARRPATQRLAHLLTELEQRAQDVAGAAAGQAILPISQIDLADSLGLSTVHVNRVLRRLREKDLIQLRRGEVEVTNPEGLRAVAGFDDRYLTFGGSSGRPLFARLDRQ